MSVEFYSRLRKIKEAKKELERSRRNEEAVIQRHKYEDQRQKTLEQKSIKAAEIRSLREKTLFLDSVLTSYGTRDLLKEIKKSKLLGRCKGPVHDLNLSNTDRDPIAEWSLFTKFEETYTKPIISMEGAHVGSGPVKTREVIKKILSVSARQLSDGQIYLSVYDPEDHARSAIFSENYSLSIHQELGSQMQASILEYLSNL